MSIFLKKFFENDEPIPIQKIVASLFALTLIRSFLEFFSNPDQSGFIFGWETTYLHFPLFYFSLFLSFTLLLFIFTRKTIARIWNFLLPVFMLILIPPISDLLISKGAPISYLAIEPQNFISTFLKFLYFSGEPGITIGLRIAGFLILSMLALFIFINTKSIVKAAMGAFGGYVILFVCAIIPSIAALPYSLLGNADSAKNIYAMALNKGLIQTTRQALPLSITAAGQQNFFHALFMSQVFWVLVVMQLLLIFILLNSKYRKIFIENFPLTRIVYWTFIALIGIYLSQKSRITIDLRNITTLISFCAIFLLGVLNTLVAVCINDGEDTAIDAVSNPNRPLVKKTLSSSQLNKFVSILIVLIVLGLATMNAAVIFFFVLTQMTYYIYSAHPFRLKRNFISSSLIISVSSVSVALAGFFFVSPDQHFAAFPFEAIWIIAVSFGLLSNLKDIKDYEGDKIEKIKTMPVVFGLENSKKIISLIFALVFISVPILINKPKMLFFSIASSLFAFYLFTKKPYQEKYIFMLLFLYAAMLFLTVVL